MPKRKEVNKEGGKVHTEKTRKNTEKHGETREKHGWWRRFKKAKWQLIMAGFDCSYCLLALLLGQGGSKCLAAPFKRLKLQGLLRQIYTELENFSSVTTFL
jgi:hypothetical protein